MDTISESSLNGISNAVKSIVFAGLLAGVLDLAAACATNYWISPVRIFQSIAAGIYGRAAYEGGAKTAVLGVFLHFVIAFGAAVVFYLASRKINFLVNQWIISGMLYGVAVYFFMQFIVLPLSNFPGKNNFQIRQVIIGLIVHILCVGLPIAFVVSRNSNAKNLS